MPDASNTRQNQPPKARGSGKSMVLHPPFGPANGINETETSVFYKMATQVNDLDMRQNQIETKVDKIGRAVRILQDDMAGHKRDIHWLMGLFGIGVTVLIAVLSRLFDKQDVLSNQIFELIQQLTNK